MLISDGAKTLREALLYRIDFSIPLTISPEVVLMIFKVFLVFTHFMLFSFVKIFSLQEPKKIKEISNMFQTTGFPIKESITNLLFLL